MEVVQKIKKQNYLMIQQSHFWVYISNGNKIKSESGRDVNFHVHCSITHNSQNMKKTKSSSMDERIKKT